MLAEGPIELTRIIEKEIQLSSVGMGEPTDLQIDVNQAAQTAVEKGEVHSMPFVPGPSPSLPGNERGIISEFQEELFQAVDQSVFQGAFGVLILKAKELQHHWVFDFFLSRGLVLGDRTLCSPD